MAPGPQRAMFSMFLFQAEALVLSLLLSGLLYSVSAVLKISNECFMELHSSFFISVVLFITMVFLITTAAFTRAGVSVWHQGFGHASISAIVIALTIYGLGDFKNTMCVSIFIAGIAIIFFIPVLCCVFTSTPIEITPPVFFTRELMFLLGTTLLYFESATEQHPLWYAILIPAFSIMGFHVICSLWALFIVSSWMDVIPHVFVTTLPVVYIILVYTKAQPFNHLDDVARYTVLGCLSASVVLCVIFVVVNVLRLTVGSARNPGFPSQPSGGDGSVANPGVRAGGRKEELTETKPNDNHNTAYHVQTNGPNAPFVSSMRYPVINIQSLITPNASNHTKTL